MLRQMPLHKFSDILDIVSGIFCGDQEQFGCRSQHPGGKLQTFQIQIDGGMMITEHLTANRKKHCQLKVE